MTVTGLAKLTCDSHLNFRFRECFEQEVPSHSGNYRVWINSKTRTWDDKNIQYEQTIIQTKEILEKIFGSAINVLWRICLLFIFNFFLFSFFIFCSRNINQFEVFRTIGCNVWKPDLAIVSVRKSYKEAETIKTTKHCIGGESKSDWITRP